MIAYSLIIIRSTYKMRCCHQKYDNVKADINKVQSGINEFKYAHLTKIKELVNIINYFSIPLRMVTVAKQLIYFS